jgi:hypothetical protein
MAVSLSFLRCRAVTRRARSEVLPSIYRLYLHLYTDQYEAIRINVSKVVLLIIWLFSYNLYSFLAVVHETANLIFYEQTERHLLHALDSPPFHFLWAEWSTWGRFRNIDRFHHAAVTARAACQGVPHCGLPGVSRMLLSSVESTVCRKRSFLVSGVTASWG